MNTLDSFKIGDRVSLNSMYTGTIILSSRGHGIHGYEGCVLCKMDPPFLGWSSLSSLLFPANLTPSDNLVNLQWIPPQDLELIGIYDGYDIDA